MGWIIVLVVLVCLALWLRHGLVSEDLSAYDDHVEPLWVDNAASAAHAEQEAEFCSYPPGFTKLSKKQQLRVIRDKLDDQGRRHPIDARVEPAQGSPVPGEWVLAEGADPNKRLLYIHGGAFSAGSPQSHRALTSKFSEISGAAVFCVAYRLIPENKRLDGLDDCQRAYRWLIDNGPDGAATAEQLYVAGDSAGGNLCLVVLAWIRDQKLQQPTAAVALSPTVDGTLSSPSIAKNLACDRMLRPAFGPLLRSPRGMLLSASWLLNRARPSDPRLSPIHGDLSGLAPLLIQASTAECLEDDARRYTNKARASGSPVELQLWSNMMHVWQLFEPELDEAKHAFEHIEAFIAQHDSSGSGA